MVDCFLSCHARGGGHLPLSGDLLHCNNLISVIQMTCKTLHFTTPIRCVVGFNMARPIRETPILFGEDARRFLARMQENRKESPEARARRLKNYEFMKKAYEIGMAEKRAREAANGGVDPCFKQV